MNEREIVLTALEMEHLAERERYLDEACGQNAPLRERIDQMLQLSGMVESFMETPAPVLGAIIDAADPTLPSAGPAKLIDQELKTGVLGDFRIGREIGRGGMGVVYEAEQISLGRRVALKTLPLAGILDKTQLIRFRNESRAAASLDHPNVVSVYAVGSDRGVHYYAMQLIDGYTIGDLIDQRRNRLGLKQTQLVEQTQRPIVTGIDSEQSSSARSCSADGPTEEFTPAVGDRVRSEHLAKDMRADAVQAAIDTQRAHQTGTRWNSDDKAWIRRMVELCIQAANALEHAHHMGIVHRDIKPSNLLIDGEGDLAIADFGLALVESDGNLTSTGSMIGTLRYMSPEQLRGDRRVLDHHTDIYSLGATLYQMLTLQPAFPDTDVTRLMQRIPHDEPASPRKGNRAIARDLETIVLKAMAKDQDARYATAAEMAADLQRFLDDEPIQAKPPGPINRVNKWAKRHRPIVVTAVGTIVACIVVAGGLLWRERSETFAALEREMEQRELAEEQEALAIAAKNEARRQAKATQKEYARAEDNLDLALAAMDTVYLDAIGRDKLLGEPISRPDQKDVAKPIKSTPLTELERELLQRGLTFYDQFAQQNQASPRAAIHTAQAFYRVALLQTAIGDAEDAAASYRASIKRFDKLAKQHPDNADYFRQLAEAYSGLANVLPEWSQAKEALKESRDAYFRAIQREPGNMSHYLARGAIGMRLVDPQALEDYEKALELEPDNVQLHILLSRYHRDTAFGSRSSRKAREHAEKALALEPDSHECHLQMAAVVGGNETVTIGKSQQTTHTYSNKEQVLEHYDRAIELAPDLARCYRKRGGFHARTGDYQRAVADLDRVLELNQEDYSALSSRAKVYVCLGRPREAIPDLKAVLAANPHNAGAYGTLGGAYIGIKDWSAAVEAYSQYLERIPTKYHIYKRRAFAYSYLDDYDRVLEDLRQSLAIHKNDTSALRWLPDERVISAPESFKQGLVQLAQEAVDRSTQPARAYANRARMYTQLKEYEKALADFDELLRLAELDASPNTATTINIYDHWAHNAIAWLLVTCPDPSVQDAPRAMKLAGKAVKFAADNGGYWNTLGVAQYRGGNWTSAITSLEKSLELGDTGKACNEFFLAMANWQLGKHEEARHWYQEAVAWMKQEDQHDEDVKRFFAEATETLEIEADR